MANIEMSRSQNLGAILCRCRRHKSVVIAAVLVLPFICGLFVILITGDQIPANPSLWWLNRLIQFGSLLISFLLPLAIIRDSSHRLTKHITSSLLFIGAWVLTQFIAIAALAILSVVLYGAD